MAIKITIKEGETLDLSTFPAGTVVEIIPNTNHDESHVNRMALIKRLEDERVDELLHLPEVPEDVMAWIKSKAKSNKIIPFDISGSHKQYQINNITAKEIEKILGFKSNMSDDDQKVKYSWGFKVNNKKCAIWDYKGSHKYNEFSAWGDYETLVSLFGNRVSKS